MRHFDPPYRPLNASAFFNSYDSSGFNDESQKELAEYLTWLHENNTVHLLLSNSDPKNTDPEDDFSMIYIASSTLNESQQIE